MAEAINEKEKINKMVEAINKMVETINKMVETKKDG